MLAFLGFLYGLSGLAACALYWPQLRRLARDAQARRGMEPATWGGWCGLGLVSMAYLVAGVGDPWLIAVAGLNWACQVAVLAMALGQRWRDRRPSQSDIAAIRR